MSTTNAPDTANHSAEIRRLRDEEVAHLRARARLVSPGRAEQLRELADCIERTDVSAHR